MPCTPAPTRLAPAPERTESACTSNPNTAWILQQTRNLLMELDDRQRQARFLTTTATRSSRARLRRPPSERKIKIPDTRAGAEANAHMERWVDGVRRECLDRLLIIRRWQLEHVLRAYVRHYNRQRPHSALDLNPRAETTHSPTRTTRARRLFK